MDPKSTAGDMQSSSGLKIKPKIMNHHFDTKDRKHVCINVFLCSNKCVDF